MSTPPPWVTPPLNPPPTPPKVKPSSDGDGALGGDKTTAAAYALISRASQREHFTSLQDHVRALYEGWWWWWCGWWGGA